MITVNNKYDSSELLFSIPVHEKQDVVNNTVENIFNFNPNSKIILHISKNFDYFDEKYSNYKNLYFNYSNFDYVLGEDLLVYHVSNFNYAINTNILFEYFILCASNELYIKKNSINYIKKYKNGIQIVPFNKEADWHNFNKNIENTDLIYSLFKSINNNIICGGQTEGQFFQKHIFSKIKDIYLNITKNNNIKINFEAEEIIPQTIFNTLDLEYGKPLTLQNYTNKITLSKDFIKNLIKGCIIPDNKIKSQLISPHVNLSSQNIYSIKRVDRTFNSIRNFLTEKGIILNNDSFSFDTYYYSNNSSLIFNKNFEIFFEKKIEGFKDFQWFGFFLKKGYYYLEFEFKTDKYINEFQNCGIKLHRPYNYIISNFFSNYSNEFKLIKIPIINNNDQNIIFIFDDYLKKIKFQMKNLKIYENFTNNNNKKNIIIVLFKKSNFKSENYNNFKSNIIDILSKIYNIFIICILNNNSNEKYIIKNYTPNIIYESDNIDFHKILFYLNKFINDFNLSFEFSLLINLDIVFIKNISQINIIINKLNFLSYEYNNNNIDLSYDFCLIPNEFIKNLNNDTNNIMENLLKKSIEYNLLIKDFYNDYNQFIYFNKINYKIKKNGYLFEKSYLNNILYYNNFSFFKKIENNHFYFYKKFTNKIQEFQWFGYFLKFSKENNNIININIKFDIIIKNEFKIFNDVGLKTHYPLKIYNEFFKNIKSNDYYQEDFIIPIKKKNQLIIFNFDNYFPEIELEIKNFKIIYNNNS